MPDPSSLKNEVNMVFKTLPLDLGFEVPYFYWLFDPDNFIGMGSDGAAADAWTGNDNYGAVSWNAPSMIPANGVLEVPFTIMEAHAGDNWIVVSSASQKRVTDAKMDNSSETTRYDVISNDTTDEKANRSKMLTVWRTLWMELDQMEMPNYRTGPNYDGFDPAKEYAGSLTDANGNPIEGLWATYQIANEPVDFDLAFQPPKPDISLLQSAMLAACIVVEEVDQSSGNSSWITGDSASQNPGAWDLTTPFVKHEPVSLTNSAKTEIADQSRDITIYCPTFWCVHGIGAYENHWDEDGVLGEAAIDDALFLNYEEQIRDFANTESDAKPLAHLRKIVTFHEVLHLFDLKHEDGGIMATGDSNPDPNGIYLHEPSVLRTANTRSDYLLPEHIKKVQAKDYPR